MNNLQATINTKKSIAEGFQNGLKFLPQYIGLQIITFLCISIIIVFTILGILTLSQTNNILTILFSVIFAIIAFLCMIYFTAVQIKFVANYSQSQKDKFKTIFNVNFKQTLRAILILLKISIPYIIGVLGLLAGVFMLFGINFINVIPTLLFTGEIPSLFTPTNLAIVAFSALIFLGGIILSIIWYFKYSLGVIHVINTTQTYKETITLCNKIMHGNKFKYFITMLLAVLLATISIVILSLLSAITTESILILSVILSMLTMIASIFINNFYILTTGSIYHQLFSNTTPQNSQNLDQPHTNMPTQETPSTQTTTQPLQPKVELSPQAQSAPQKETINENKETSQQTPIIPVLADLENAKKEAELNNSTNSNPVAPNQTHINTPPQETPPTQVPTQPEPLSSLDISISANPAPNTQQTNTDQPSTTEQPSINLNSQNIPSQVQENSTTQINPAPETPLNQNNANSNQTSNTFNLDLRQENNNNGNNNNQN